MPQKEARAMELYREAAGTGKGQAKQALSKMKGLDCDSRIFPDLDVSFIQEETQHDLTATYTLIGYICKYLMVDRFAEVYPQISLN